MLRIAYNSNIIIDQISKQSPNSNIITYHKSATLSAKVSISALLKNDLQSIRGGQSCALQKLYLLPIRGGNLFTHCSGYLSDNQKACSALARFTHPFFLMDFYNFSHVESWADGVFDGHCLLFYRRGVIPN